MKKAILLSVAAHIALLLAFIFFRLPADTPAGDAGMVVIEVEGVDEDCHSCEGRNLPSFHAGDPHFRGDDRPSIKSQTTNSTSQPVNSQLANPQHGTPSGNPILTKIRSKIERSKYYPPEAQRQKLEGRPKVTFQIKEDGEIAYISLLESSGSAILDNAALETIRRSAPLPYYSEPIILSIKFSSKNK